MRTTLIVAGVLSCGLGLGTAQAAGAQKKSKHRYGHVSNKSAHKEHDPDLTGAAGVSISQSTGESESDDQRAGPALFVGGRIAYRLTERYSMLATAGYFISSGLADPTAGVGATIPVSSNVVTYNSISASAPVSKVSRDSYKITTVSASGGPQVEHGAWRGSLVGLLSMSWYSKTVIVEEVEEADDRSTLWLQGHEHHGGGSSSFPEESEGTGDREFNRYGIRASAGKTLTANFRLDSAIGLTQVTHQFGPLTWISEATLAQATYFSGHYSGYLGLALTSENASITVPSRLSLAVGGEYLFN